MEGYFPWLVCISRNPLQPLFFFLTSLIFAPLGLVHFSKYWIKIKTPYCQIFLQSHKDSNTEYLQLVSLALLGL